ncbi:aspartate-semialdehyde dehydrogenase [uncultured Thermanaerothrix sp.]|uniref:aspartate-semialdehyde dehydrogenase n=1 Tax=uncultured Thermanaerothrix sp. TaxID=1195149 RepID=UPI002632256C|nr:aspartate-semialdehyde dehydrogenase [uncultured Thermanaerothrix sp.]
MEPIPVAILGATGVVGQRFVQLLDGHPWFKVTTLCASDRSVGKAYKEGCRWLLDSPMPAWAASMILQPTTAEVVHEPIAFSALPAEVAREVEPLLAQKGCVVCSNASAHRMEEDVPLLLPEVNAEHIELIRWQREQRGWRGAIVTNPNCTSTGMTVILKALDQAFGVKRAIAVSMQALSGAGYPGVASLEIMDNVIPFIRGEEEKVAWEPRKMLGALRDGRVVLHPVVISAQTNRVAVLDGHMVCLTVECKTRPTPEDAIRVLEAYAVPEPIAGLPSTPRPPVVVRLEDDRPQPRLDRMSGRGMSTVVGRIRADEVLDLKMVVLSHNTIRGAAGASIYNAELVVRAGLLA